MGDEDGRRITDENLSERRVESENGSGILLNERRGMVSLHGNTRSEEKNTILYYISRLNMEYPRAYK